MTDSGALRTITTAGLTFYDFLYDPATVLDAHGHADAFVSFVLAGGYTATSGRTNIPYTPGTAIYHVTQHEHHVIVGNRPARALVIDIPDALRERLREVEGREPPFLFRDRGPIAWLCSRVHGEVVSWSAGSALILEGLVLEILGGIAKVRGPAGDSAEPPWLRRVDELLRTRFDSALTVGHIAQLAGVHPVHLSRTWRRFRGCSIGSSVHRARIEEACRRIAAGGESLSEVALAVGFADQTHFSRVFKRVTGTTPGAFRKRQR